MKMSKEFTAWELAVLEQALTMYVKECRSTFAPHGQVTLDNLVKKLGDMKGEGR